MVLECAGPAAAGGTACVASGVCIIGLLGLAIIGGIYDYTTQNSGRISVYSSATPLSVVALHQMIILQSRYAGDSRTAG